METVHLVVRSLETKLGRLAYTQDRTTRGIYDLCEFTKRLDQSPKADTRQVTSSTSRPAIESSERIVRVASLPPALEPESPRIEAPKVVRSSTVMSASGLSLLAGTTIPPKRSEVNTDIKWPWLNQFCCVLIIPFTRALCKSSSNHQEGRKKRRKKQAEE
eukprot:XP_023157804.1 uncharacterized protein LOC111589252 isoform X2 [Zea mays]